MKHLVSLMVSLFFVFGVLLVNAAAGVNINIGISAPPLEFAAPPDVVVVPSGASYVYMVPDTPGVYFYDDYWYRFYGGHWFRAAIYSGPWAYVATSLVPVLVVDVPPDYIRYLPRGYHRIHYRDFHSHWRAWQGDRHWNRYDWYRQEVRERERRRHPEGYRPPRGGEHKPAVEGRGVQPGSPYKALGEKGHKPRGEGRGVQPTTPFKSLEEKGHKQKGEGQKPKVAGPHEQKGKKSEQREER